MPTHCLNCNSTTKVAAEGLCIYNYETCDLEPITFRYFNVYGESQPTKGQYAPVIGLFQKQKEAGTPMTIVRDG